VPNCFGAQRFGHGAADVEQGFLGKTLPCDVMDTAGKPTRPLRSRDHVITTDHAQALENGVAERHARASR
jgi:tRNA pseudouridine13 synthase